MRVCVCVCVRVCASVCVCVSESENESESERKFNYLLANHISKSTLPTLHLPPLAQY